MNRVLPLLFAVLLTVWALVSCDITPAETSAPETEAPETNAAALPCISYNALVAWANWTEDPDIITKSLNFEAMAISREQHLPIFKCESRSDLEQFKAQFADSLSFDYGYNGAPSVEEATAGFDAVMGSITIEK